MHEGLVGMAAWEVDFPALGLDVNDAGCGEGERPDLGAEFEGEEGEGVECLGFCSDG